MAHIGKKFWWAVPQPTDMKEFIGRHVKVVDDDGRERVVEIERVMGSLVHKNKFEIVSREKHYIISMLEFFAQMNGEKLSKEEIEWFDEMQFEVIPPPKFGNKKNGLWR